MTNETRLWLGIIAALVAIAALDTWEDVERSRAGCREERPTVELHYEGATPTECKPSAQACAQALSAKCQEQADGGTWEAVPYCDCVGEGCAELDEATRDSIDEWRKMGPRL